MTEYEFDQLQRDWVVKREQALVIMRERGRFFREVAPRGEVFDEMNRCEREAWNKEQDAWIKLSNARKEIDHLRDATKMVTQEEEQNHEQC